MGSVFISKKKIKGSSVTNSSNVFSAFKQVDDDVYLQFVTGTVMNVVTGPESVGYSTTRDVNAVFARSHMTGNLANKKNKYYPLFRGMIDPPVKGEQVLLCTFGGVNYYLGPVNTTNLPNYNIDHIYEGTSVQKKQADSTEGGSGKSVHFPQLKFNRLAKYYNPEIDFPEGADLEKTSPIQTYPDMVLEGRYGNSIRLGGRFTSPYVVISNARHSTNAIESNLDGSIMAFFKKGTISQNFSFDHKIKDKGTDTEELVFSPFTLGSDSIESYDGQVNREVKRFIGHENYNYEYNQNQMLFNSNRITINSKLNDVTVSSFNNLFLGSGNNTKLISNGYTSLDSSNIYLGEQARLKIENGEEAEPLVLGLQLKNIFKEVVDILKDFKVSGVVGGISGPPSPDILSRIENLTNKLDSPTFLSDYHYIEDNGQKPDDRE